jgi:hypothetical protein
LSDKTTTLIGSDVDNWSTVHMPTMHCCRWGSQPLDIITKLRRSKDLGLMHKEHPTLRQ